jgi:hypothetical protein
LENCPTKYLKGHPLERKRIKLEKLKLKQEEKTKLLLEEQKKKEIAKNAFKVQDKSKLWDQFLKSHMDPEIFKQGPHSEKLTDLGNAKKQRATL